MSMHDIKCPGCGKSIQPEDSSCPECGRSIKKTKGKPLTLQFIVETDKMSSFSNFINELSEHIRKNYDINNFSYSQSNVLDEEGGNAGFTRVLMNITEDEDILEFIGDWVDNKLQDLNLYKNSEIYKAKFKANTERRACPSCSGTGKVIEEQKKEKCACQNGYIYTRNI
jgi:rRNA maturation endonuclease Nob1